jgi:glutathione S-transferase
MQEDDGRHYARVMLTLYDAARCPYCARVRIALAEKGLEWEAVAVDLDDRPDWLYEKNPLGKVPGLEEDGWALPESVVILEYLEERWPEPPLLPPDPADRAVVRLRVHRFETALGKAYYAFRRKEDGAAERLAHCLGALDRGLAPWPYPFGLADIAYVPWLLRARDMLGVDLAPYPALRTRLDEVSQRPSVAAELEVVATL